MQAVGLDFPVQISLALPFRVPILFCVVKNLFNDDRICLRDVLKGSNMLPDLSSHQHRSAMRTTNGGENSTVDGIDARRASPYVLMLVAHGMESVVSLGTGCQ